MNDRIARPVKIVCVSRYLNIAALLSFFGILYDYCFGERMLRPLVSLLCLGDPGPRGRDYLASLLSAPNLYLRKKWTWHHALQCALAKCLHLLVLALRTSTLGRRGSFNVSHRYELSAQCKSPVKR